MKKEDISGISNKKVLCLSDNNPQGDKTYRFTDLQVKAAKLRVQGYSLAQIGDKLGGRKANNISVALRKFRRVSKHMREVVRDLSKAHYWEMQLNRNELMAKITEKRREMIREGFWVLGKQQVPKGYQLDEQRKLFLVPTQAEPYKRVFIRVKKGEVPYAAAKKEHVNPRRIYNKLRDPLYKGEYTYAGETNRHFCEPLVSSDTWDKVQKRIGLSGASKLPPGYELQDDGRKVLKPGGKTMYEQIFRMRLERESYEKIAKEVHLSRKTVKRIIKNRMITGKVEVEGRFVDSGFEQAVDEKTWEDTQKIHPYLNSEQLKDQALERRKQIKELLPVFRWELREKLGVSKTAVIRNVNKLKEEKKVKERYDGLLQSVSEPFPKMYLGARHKSRALKMQRIFDVLLRKDWMTKKELDKETGLSHDTLNEIIRKLASIGFVERKYGKVRLSQLGRKAESTVKNHFATA